MAGPNNSQKIANQDTSHAQKRGRAATWLQESSGAAGHEPMEARGGGRNWGEPLAGHFWFCSFFEKKKRKKVPTKTRRCEQTLVFYFFAVGNDPCLGALSSWVSGYFQELAKIKMSLSFVPPNANLLAGYGNYQAQLSGGLFYALVGPPFSAILRYIPTVFLAEQVGNKSGTSGRCGTSWKPHEFPHAAVLLLAVWIVRLGLRHASSS